MNENAPSAREIIERLVIQSGITKKLAAEILRAIPDIIEEGLKKDGEVRVKGFGTFRLRWTRGRMGRNPKTGERVEIPSHNRVVFLPEQAFKEYINRDYRLLSYKIIPPAEKASSVDETFPETEIIEQNQYQYQPQPIPAPQPELEPEPAPPIRKRRVHWIVPLAVSVIIILSLVFYFRNCHHSSQQSVVDSRQLTVDSNQQSAAERSEVPTLSGSAVSSQQSAAERSEVPTQSGSAVGSQQSAVDNRQSTISSSPSALSPSLIISTAGKHLFRLAREIYGNPYLWVLIYKENLDKIPDPDMLISGRELLIPILEGTPGKLTRNDSLAVSEGYSLVYEYYKAMNDPRKNDFFRAMIRYKPK